MGNQIVNVNSGLALAVEGASMDKGAQIIQWPPPGDNPNNLLWRPVGSGSQFQFINANSGLALAVDGASTTKGAGIVQWPPPGDNPKNQLWTVEPTGAEIGSKEFRIVNVNSGLALGAEGASKAKGTQIVQWPPPGDNPNNLMWTFNVTFSVQPGDGEFSYEGAGFVPGSTVQVTSSFAAVGGTTSGGPHSYTVASDGTFSDTISVDYFDVAGVLTVTAIDENQPPPYSAVWEGPAGG